MPYPAGHREEVREKIVLSARKLFNQFGFDNVSVDRIMADAGLTRGGFYTYFKCKSELYAEVLQCFFTDPNWKNRWEGVHVDPSAADRVRKSSAPIYRASISKTSETPVRWSRLPSDVARSGKVREGRVRKRVPGHDRRAGAKSSSQWRAEPRYSASDRGFVHRWNGGSACAGRSRASRRIARIGDVGGAQPGRLEPKLERLAEIGSSIRRTKSWNLTSERRLSKDGSKISSSRTFLSS